MHPSHMHWSEPSPQALQLAAFLPSCSRVAARKWHMRLSSGSHAGAKGSRVRARSGACCGGSCVAGMPAPRVAIFWRGCHNSCCWPLKHTPLRRGVFSPSRVHTFVLLRPAASWGFPQMWLHPMRKGKKPALILAHTNLRPARPIAASGRFAAVQWSQWVSFFTGDFDHWYLFLLRELPDWFAR